MEYLIRLMHTKPLCDKLRVKTRLMKTINKSQLKILIAKGKLQQVVEILAAPSNSLDDIDLFNEAIMLSGRYNEWEMDSRKKIRPAEQLEVRKNDIQNSVIFLIDRLPDSITFPAPPSQASPSPAFGIPKYNIAVIAALALATLFLYLRLRAESDKTKEILVDKIEKISTKVADNNKAYVLTRNKNTLRFGQKAIEKEIADLEEELRTKQFNNKEILDKIDTLKHENSKFK